jgi:hypothetical protein
MVCIRTVGVRVSTFPLYFMTLYRSTVRVLEFFLHNLYTLEFGPELLHRSGVLVGFGTN